MTPLCPIHGKPPLLVYMCCRGAQGGKIGGHATTQKKKRASKRNGRKGGRPPSTKAPPVSP